MVPAFEGFRTFPLRVERVDRETWQGIYPHTSTTHIPAHTQHMHLLPQDSGSTLQQDFATSDAKGFFYGMKLVRGAYMEQERYNAAQKGYPDPIFSTKDGTDGNYHQLLEVLLQRVRRGRTHIMVASHNEQSVQLAINRSVPTHTPILW